MCFCFGLCKPIVLCLHPLLAFASQLLHCPCQLCLSVSLVSLAFLSPGRWVLQLYGILEWLTNCHFWLHGLWAWRLAPGNAAAGRGGTLARVAIVLDSLHGAHTGDYPVTPPWGRTPGITLSPPHGVRTLYENEYRNFLKLGVVCVQLLLARVREWRRLCEREDTLPSIFTWMIPPCAGVTSDFHDCIRFFF